MHIVVINLKRASKRRAQMAQQFRELGLPYEIKEAIDGRRLSAEHLAQVDWQGRRQLGLPPQANGSIANWLTHREVMRDLVDNGPDMMAIIEDDAILAPELSEVLSALEQKRFSFDVVALHRRRLRSPFVPCASVTARHRAGRVRYWASGGSEGIVISRDAARYFLETVPRMVLTVDHELLRYWRTGLNVLHVDPPVIHHGGIDDSQIRGDRLAARRRRRETEYIASVLWRRLLTVCGETVQKRIVFRKLMRGEMGVTRWQQPPGHTPT